MKNAGKICTAPPIVVIHMYSILASYLYIIILSKHIYAENLLQHVTSALQKQNISFILKRSLVLI